MKCIKQKAADGKTIIKRTKNEEALLLVSANWDYCPKKFWNEQVRDENKSKEVPKKVEKTEVKEVKDHKRSKYARKNKDGQYKKDYRSSKYKQEGIEKTKSQVQTEN